VTVLVIDPVDTEVWWHVSHPLCQRRAVPTVGCPQLQGYSSALLRAGLFCKPWRQSSLVWMWSPQMI